MEVLQDTYTKIGLNLEILNGFPAKSTFFNNENKGLPLIRIRNILKGHSETYYSGEFDSKYLIKKGDILIGMDGDFNIAKWTGIPSILNQRICKLIDAKDPFNLEYLYYYLEVELKKIQARTPSTTVKHLSINDLRKVNAYCPPLPEQQKIAAILSTVDEQISTTDKIIEKSKELKKGLMQKLFSEGIQHTEFKDSKIGRIPKDWEVLKVSDLLKRAVISSIQDGNHGGIHPKSSDFVPEGIPFIMANSITKNNKLKLEGVSRISVEQYQTLRIGFAEPKDILLTHKGTVGLTAIVNDSHGSLMLTPQVTYYRIPNEDVLERRFLYYYFQSNIFQKIIDRYSTQSTRAYIGITNQKKLPLILPNSISEQQKIVAILSEADAKIEKEQTQKAQLEQLKKGLMQQLLTGKKRVKV